MDLARQFLTNHGASSVSNDSNHLIGGLYRVGVLAPRRHILAILWPQASQNFSEGSLKVPRPGALDAYFGNIMAPIFTKVSRRFLKGSWTWRPGGILQQHPVIIYHIVAVCFPELSKGSATLRSGGIPWQYYGLEFPKSFPKVPQRFLNLAPQSHILAILWP